ncbi:MAG: lamin tail domain-containing protein [Candidatus Berkelbacteria bacterium]|nr:lamin tail domain-containing protein [Candidatus Berkelbacteria bacterium]
MGKTKKTFILLTVVILAFGYSLASLTVMPQKASASLLPVKINEFMPRPSSGNEWIELYNQNATPVSISDYVLDDEDGGHGPFIIPAGTVIAGYGFYTETRSFGLDNSGDTVRLLDDHGNLIDSFSYTGSTLGETYARLVDGDLPWNNGTTSPTKNKSNDTTKPDASGAEIDVLGKKIAGKIFINKIDELTFNWDGFIDNESIIIEYEWEVYDDTDTEIYQGTIAGDANGYTLAGIGLDEGREYKVEVADINNAWLESDEVESLSIIADVSAPSAIEDLTVSEKPYDTDGQLHLIWSASADNLGGSGVEKYEVYRVTSSTTVLAGWVLHDEAVTSYNFTDNFYGDSVWVEYYVLVVDKVNNKTSAGDSGIDSTIVDTVAPAAPVINYTRDGNIITINWQAVAGATSYVVYRDGAPIPVGGALSYIDYSSKKGETHSYYVVAVDAVGNVSAPSNTLEIYVPKPKVSSVATTGEVQGTSTGTTEKTEQVSPSPSPSPSGEVKASESSKPAETAETKKTNWSLIIAIIIAAAIVIAGVLYWWYAREEEDEI